jgi:hypothetical protein
MASSSSVEIDPEILATLATKADLAPLATREEMYAAIAAATAPLATRDEMHAAIAAAIAPLATREELNAAIAPLATREELLSMRAELRAEIREEGDRTRRYFDVVAERLETSINIIAEGHPHLDAKIDGVRRELKADIADLDRRVTKLEARRRPR